MSTFRLVLQGASSGQEYAEYSANLIRTPTFLNFSPDNSHLQVSKNERPIFHIIIKKNLTMSKYS